MQHATGPEDSKRSPRVTVALLSHRDAAFIGEAIAGALAQTVPCEIIVSNDCSDDGTHEIASALLAGYRGPHQVSVRRTARNLGVAGHVNDVLPLARGGIIVMIAEVQGRPVKAGESFSAAHVVGYFDTIEEMHRVYDRYKGHTGLTADASGWGPVR